jgi:hypothetical protein
MVVFLVLGLEDGRRKIQWYWKRKNRQTKEVLTERARERS